MILETNRLILRELTYDDFDALYNVLADSDIMVHYPYKFDENRDPIKSVVINQVKDGQFEFVKEIQPE